MNGMLKKGSRPPQKRHMNGMAKKDPGPSAAHAQILSNAQTTFLAFKSLLITYMWGGKKSSRH